MVPLKAPIPVMASLLAPAGWLARQYECQAGRRREHVGQSQKAKKNNFFLVLRRKEIAHKVMQIKGL